jgi:Icc-related predicted phosphoesterase
VELPESSCIATCRIVQNPIKLARGCGTMGKLLWTPSQERTKQANMTPWNCPGDLPEEELAKKLEKATSGLTDPGNSILNFHCPPCDTQIDVAPKRDKDLRPVLTPGGEPEMAYVGSTAVRQMIEKLQPLAGLHGHIHESRGLSKVGKSVCFNPGSEYVTGVLRGLILNLSDKKIDNYVFTER